jgi:hypothetical protein
MRTNFAANARMLLRLHGGCTVVAEAALFCGGGTLSFALQRHPSEKSGRAECSQSVEPLRNGSGQAATRPAKRFGKAPAPPHVVTTNIEHPAIEEWVFQRDCTTHACSCSCTCTNMLMHAPILTRVRVRTCVYEHVGVCARGEGSVHVRGLACLFLLT